VAGPVNTDFDDEVLARISEGESLRAICADLKDFGCPAASTFCGRVIDDKSFAERYARARDLQYEAWACLIREQSAKCRLGEIVTEKGDGTVETKTVDSVDRSKLEVDSLKWLLAKLHPKRYGDKLAVGGADDLGPVQLSWKSRESNSTTRPETKA
jgi:hypothetical protein